MKSRLIRMALLSIMLASFVGISMPSPAATDKLPNLTLKDVKALIAIAKTPEQHQRIAHYFNQEAEKCEGEAKDHDEMIEIYRKSPVPWASKTPGPTGTIEHCEFLAKLDQEMAKALRDMAAAHEEMAKQASKK